MKNPRIITIDGPAGAGKSTLAKEIAQKFGYQHLDSGALYRAIGVACKRAGVDLTEQEKVLEVARKLKVELRGNRVLVNGEDFTREIRTPEAGVLASRVAQFPQVREIVVKILRETAKGKKVVIDGRDAGTYIFPEAELKIYLTASPEERAKRGYKELTEKGFKVTYEEVLREIISRDESDRNRAFAPLTIPEGAVIIDSTGKSLREILRTVKELIDP